MAVMDTAVVAPLAGARAVTAHTPSGPVQFVYRGLGFDPRLGAAVRSYRKYNAASAARLLLSWVVEDITGDPRLPVWRRVEALDQATLSAVMFALADDRRRVLAERLEDRRARGR
jgi:hypothetical protein